MMKNVISHRFLDEAGDSTFFKKGRILAVGEKGISLAFSRGMVKFNSDLGPLRAEIRRMQDEIAGDEYLNRIKAAGIFTER